MEKVDLLYYPLMLKPIVFRIKKLLGIEQLSLITIAVHGFHHDISSILCRRQHEGYSFYRIK